MAEQAINSERNRPLAPRCFQCKPGVTVEQDRVVHYTKSTEDDETLRAWCRETFNLADVEATSQPNTPPKPDLAAPLKPCVACQLRRMAARDRAKAARGQEVRLPASDRYTMWLLKQSEWLLMDVATRGIPEKTLTKPEHHAIADVCHQLSQAFRERAEKLFEVGDSSTSDTTS